MVWEATDQFGNLYVAESDARSLQDLRPHLRSLLEELRARAGERFRVTIDPEYGEVSGPAPDGVSHVVRCEWLSEAGAEGVADLARELCNEMGLPDVEVSVGGM